MTLDERVKHYKAHVHTMDELQKAKAEDAIWNGFLAVPGRPPAGSKTLIRREYLRQVVGSGTYDSENRATLLHGLPETQGLWDAVMGRKMLLQTAANIYRLAKKTAVANGLSLATALQHAIEEYESRPYLIMVGGIPVRRGKPSKPADLKGDAKRVRVTSKTVEGLFLARLRGEILDFLKDRATNIQPILREQVLSEFEVAVKVIVEEFRHKVNRLAESSDDITKADAVIARRNVTLACETLHMDPPAPGQPVDITKAKRQKKILAREYHPDVHAGDMKERMEERFHAVLTAYGVIEQYNEQLSPTGKGDGSGRDRAEGGGGRG